VHWSLVCRASSTYSTQKRRARNELIKVFIETWQWVSNSWISVFLSRFEACVKSHGSTLLVTVSFHVPPSIWASSKTCCIASYRALKLSGWAQSSKRWVMVSFNCAHRRQVGDISLSWQFCFNGWLCLLLQTIVLIDCVLALSAEICNNLSKHLPHEFFRRASRSGNLTAKIFHSLLRHVCSMLSVKLIPQLKSFISPIQVTPWRNIRYEKQRKIKQKTVGELRSQVPWTHSTCFCRQGQICLQIGSSWSLSWATFQISVESSVRTGPL